MEDKELQELFDAKRTVEANRHRQEKLRKMLAASAAPKSRRLWPVWALSAAASIALLLITLPMLFRSETAEPLLVAEATEIPTPKEEPDTTITSKTSTTSITRKARKTRNTIPLPEEPLLLAEAEVLQPAPIIITEPKPEPVETEKTEEPIETLNDTPRIHRRTSTQMVCSNCNIYNVPSPSTALQDFLAATFGTETSTPITLKTIEF